MENIMGKEETEKIGLESERLLYRPWRDEDKDMLFEEAKDEEVGPRAGWKSHKSPEDSLIVIRNILSEDNTFAIILKDTGKIIGSIGLFPSTVKELSMGEKDLEVGYWIGRGYWGNGYAPEAVRTLLSFAFLNLGAERVWCGAFEGNRNSMRVQEKCNFTFSHTEKAHIAPLDENKIVHFRVLEKKEWESLQGKNS